ncbi:hypothetical protein Tco_0443641, partial [Tanacetum coccineum]
LFKRNVPVTTFESGFPAAFPFFFAFPTAYTQPCAFPFPPFLFLCSTLKTIIPLGSCPIALLSISNVCVASAPAIAGKVPYLIALVALLGARAIMVKMALDALGQGSPVGFLLTSPHIVELCDILPLEGLLLVSMVVSG